MSLHVASATKDITLEANSQTTANGNNGGQIVIQAEGGTNLTVQAFAAKLARTLYDLQRDATSAGVQLSQAKYEFSFRQQNQTVKLAPGSLAPLAVQLGEVKAICDLLIAAKINAFIWDKYRIISTPIVRPEYQGIRVTPNIYTPLEEIDTFTTAMEDLLKNGLHLLVLRLQASDLLRGGRRQSALLGLARHLELRRLHHSRDLSQVAISHAAHEIEFDRRETRVMVGHI